MNNLPEYELLSAYLDGELTAAEQAEVERLLAASPAARRLLDELRALSTTLQDLPQEKLGEDLSRQVLRIAERRLLTEGEPGDLETAPTPAERSPFRRFFNRRTMVWLSLTTAIALLIVVSEQHNNPQPVQVARRDESLREDNQRAAGELRTPPTIEAVKDRDDKPAELERELSDKEAKSELSVISAPARPAESPRSAPPAKRSAGKAADDSYSRPGSGGTLDGTAAGEILVVRCDISHEAAKQSALDKLLVANGMARREPLDQARPYNGAKAKTLAKARQPVDAKKLAPTHAADEYFYVEATPAQLNAVLAGLKAQPEMFLAFSVKPLPGGEFGDLPYANHELQRKSTVGAAERGVRSKAGDRQAAETPRNAAGKQYNSPAPAASRPTVMQYEQRPNVAGPEGDSGLKGQLEYVVRERGQQEAAKDQSQSFGAAQDKQVQVMGQPQSLAAAAPLHRVLFVLHLASGNRPAAAAEAPNAMKADTAEPAKPAAQPTPRK
jgi:hypothetical protein